MTPHAPSAAPARSLALAWHPGDDLAILRDREWLVTNGLGGFASGSLLGIATRRHHGLFVPNLVEPKGRHVLISRLEETLAADGKTCRLGGAEYPDGRLDTDTHHYLRRFTLDHGMPTWTFAFAGRVIEKTIVMPHHHNTVCVSYRLVEGEPLRMRLRLFSAFRRQDAELVRAAGWPFVLEVCGRRTTLRLADGGPLALRFGLRPDRGVFVCDEQASEGVAYRVERDRGYPFVENHYSPGYFQAELSTDEPLTFVASAAGWESLDVDGPTVIGAECRRIERHLAVAPPAARDGFAAQLVIAADRFVVLPGSRLEEAVVAHASGDEVRTVIAGYHWFGDWGRDTMIALDGLTLATGRFGEAAAILRTFGKYVRDGLIPNLFPEGEREALYHTADATLWYFHAIGRHLAVTGEHDVLHDLFPVLEGIVEHHLAGTRFGIHVDPRDGLLAAGAEGYQLTWMDAKVDGWVVTPRRGKPVEIQALWHNALMLMDEWSATLGRRRVDYGALAARARESFNARYWNAAKGCLFDVIDGPAGDRAHGDVASRDDASGRPNQIFAVSLPHPILEPGRWQPVVDWVAAHLATPVGLRTLEPGHPDYKRTYHGDLRTRDAAYHQGTVWPWLVGHFIDAWLRVHGDRRTARTLLDGFVPHLTDAGVGSISEIMDAEAPYAPRGCIAQAWSVAEVLRAWLATEPVRD